MGSNLSLLHLLHLQEDSLPLVPLGKPKMYLQQDKYGSRWLSSGICLPVQEMEETQFRSLGREDPLGEEMATHSSIIAWRIPWTEEPGGLQWGHIGSQGVGHG